MKKKSSIVSRLERLRSRYLRQHILSLTSRRYGNCVHNVEYLPKRLPYSQNDLSTEYELAPRRQTTLVVLNIELGPEHLCMYGSDNPSSWTGELCDNDAKASNCPYFRPSHSIDEAAADFEECFSNDKYVYDNHRDIATLQWVLEVRGKRRPLFNRFIFWLLSFFTIFSLRRKPYALPGKEEELPEDFWK